MKQTAGRVIGKAVVEMRCVSFTYGSSPVLEEVNISVAPSDFVLVVGPNGGGKTTLLKLILGLLKPSGGDIKVFGKPPGEFMSRIGYMPQDTHFDPRFPITVLDVVLMGCLGRKKSFRFFGKSEKLAAVNAIRDVGLSELVERPISALSGGEVRRVLIARAMACEPDLLLLDEPTTNLDLLVEQDLYDVLRELNKKLTIIMISHDLAFVSKFVKNVICVNRTVAIHPTSDIDGKLFNEMFGKDIRMVVHNRHFRREE